MFNNERIDNAEEQALNTLETLLDFGVKGSISTEQIEAAKVRQGSAFYILSQLRPQAPWGGLPFPYPGDEPTGDEAEHGETPQEEEAATT